MNILEKILGGLAAPVVNYLGERQRLRSEERLKKAELEHAIHAKKLEQIAKAAEYEQAWNIAALENSGWKDDGWTIIFMIPFVMAFFPAAVPYIMAGFAALGSMPMWYQSFVGVAVASAFGYQQAAKIWNWWNKPSA